MNNQSQIDSYAERNSLLEAVIEEHIDLKELGKNEVPRISLKHGFSAILLHMSHPAHKSLFGRKDD
jgi:hypothetical protein